MMPLPPLNFSGGSQASKTGDQATGPLNFGSFSYSRNNPVLLIGVAIAVVGVMYLINARR